ncbi:MAG: L-seryl-tRNA(Sec) selenium transferase [Pirellulales bacterium]|nr:L-seryl-tRNA(Sec) selenium transferase [Pirellulales bacterium]
MGNSIQNILRKIPSVEILIQDLEKEQNVADVPRRILVDSLRKATSWIRKAITAGENGELDDSTLRRRILDRAHVEIQSVMQRHYRKVINATGIVLHMALGRAVLPTQAIRHIEEELSGYSLLQASVEPEQQTQRDSRIEWQLKQLTGAEAATVVNNNAAATSIVLNTVAKGKEVIVSRGQLVEIGGSFRLPDVMAASGVQLVEVGTTNKTHPRDYEAAITENSAAIMRIHPSNYKISGFTSEVALETLVEIAHAHNLIMIDDVEAGSLIDFSRFGFEHEPTLPESVQAGADLITSSADQMIGACQGGIILGRAELIGRIRKNPLARILRVGKLTLASLEATLTLFLDPSVALREVPTLQMLNRGLPEIVQQAKRIAHRVQERVQNVDVNLADGFSQMGIGFLPTQNLPTRLVSIRPAALSADEFATCLRGWSPPVFARIQKDRVLFDPRTLLEGEGSVLVDALVGILRPER